MVISKQYPCMMIATQLALSMPVQEDAEAYPALDSRPGRVEGFE